MNIRALVLDGQFKGQLIELPDARPTQLLLENGKPVQYELERYAMHLSFAGVACYGRKRFETYSLADWKAWAHLILDVRLRDLCFRFSAFTLRRYTTTNVVYNGTEYPIRLNSIASDDGRWVPFDEWYGLPLGTWDTLLGHQERISQLYEQMRLA